MTNEIKFNERQKEILALLEDDHRRDLYKAVDYKYWITHSAACNYEPLNEAEFQQLKAAGLITEKWQDCYELSDKAKS